MGANATVEWKVTVSEETDRELRALLAEQGSDAACLSGFVEEAVREQVFRRTVKAIKTRNSGMTVDKLQEIVGEALAEVRNEMANAAR